MDLSEALRTTGAVDAGEVLAGSEERANLARFLRQGDAHLLRDSFL